MSVQEMQDTALEGLQCWKRLENNTDRMHLSQQCHHLTHVRVCERVTVFHLSSRNLLLTQNSIRPALGAELRLEPHALQKQETEGALQHNDELCSGILFSSVVFSLCDGLYSKGCSFLFAGS